MLIYFKYSINSMGVNTGIEEKSIKSFLFRVIIHSHLLFKAAEYWIESSKSLEFISMAFFISLCGHLVRHGKSLTALLGFQTVSHDLVFCQYRHN